MKPTKPRRRQIPPMVEGHDQADDHHLVEVDGWAVELLRRCRARKRSIDREDGDWW